MGALEEQLSVMQSQFDALQAQFNQAIEQLEKANLETHQARGFALQVLDSVEQLAQQNQILQERHRDMLYQYIAEMRRSVEIEHIRDALGSKLNEVAAERDDLANQLAGMHKTVEAYIASSASAGRFINEQAQEIRQLREVLLNIVDAEAARVPTKDVGNFIDQGHALFAAIQKACPLVGRDGLPSWSLDQLKEKESHA